MSDPRQTYAEQLYCRLIEGPPSESQRKRPTIRLKDGLDMVAGRPEVVNQGAGREEATER